MAPSVRASATRCSSDVSVDDAINVPMPHALPDVVDLTCELMRRASLTPEDAGCQALIAERLAVSGFRIEHLPFGPVRNLWATHGAGEPVLMFLGHTDVVP